jgi:hypothetical protein
MANNYDFMLKFIIIGDSSIRSCIQVLENLASCYASPKGASKPVTSLLWGWSLVHAVCPLVVIALRCSYGIQYDVEYEGWSIIFQINHAFLLQELHCCFSRVRLDKKGQL